MEDIFRGELQTKTKNQVIDYAMQVKFERDILEKILRDWKKESKCKN